jgi:N-acetylmuramoyl-L-alanine amidase
VVVDEPAPVPNTGNGKEAEIKPDQIWFRVQVASSKNKIAATPSSFKGYEQVKVIQDGRWYKYLVGEESSYHAALEMCQEVKADYPDAFVVALKNGNILPLKEALEEINR